MSRLFRRTTNPPHNVLDQPISQSVSRRPVPTRRTTNVIVPVIAQHNELDQQISQSVRGRPVPNAPHNELDQVPPTINNNRRGKTCCEKFGSCIKRNRRIGAALADELMPEVREPDNRRSSDAQIARSSSRVITPREPAPPQETTRQVYDRALAELNDPMCMVARENMRMAYQMGLIGEGRGNGLFQSTDHREERRTPHFKTGGRVPKTGEALVHAGEYVLPKGAKPTKEQVSQVRKLKIKFKSQHLKIFTR
jgi:hypothetical protein